MRKGLSVEKIQQLAMQVPKDRPFEPRDQTGAIIPRPFPKADEPQERRADLFAPPEGGDDKKA